MRFKLFQTSVWYEGWERYIDLQLKQLKPITLIFLSLTQA